MSRTYLYTVSPNGPLTLHEEFSNSHRGAMWIWMRLRERFHPDHIWPEGNVPYDDPRMKEAMKWVMKYEDIWELSKGNRLCREEKIVLMSTYDNIMVRRKNFEELVKAFRWFVENYKKDNPENASSLLEQAAAIEKLKDNKKIYAICWNQTSVNGDAWLTYIPKKEEYRSYNIKKDKGHWFLFDDLA